MKHIYRATRPAWAHLEGWETGMILTVGLAIAGFTFFHDKLSKFIDRWADGATVVFLMFAVDAIFSTAVCLVFLKWYKRQRVGCYPSTFLYCFRIPSASNALGKSQVLGYCHIKPDMENGEIIAEGASYFWENGRLDLSTRVGFKSSQVYGTLENDETTCHIRFNINSEDLDQRLYRHGILQFRLAENAEAEKGKDFYAGYLKSTQKDTELQDVLVNSKGIAELYDRKKLLAPVKLQSALSGRANLLIGKLDDMLNLFPPPSIWAGQSVQTAKSNCWGHQIPAPQSIILNDKLYPYLGTMLDEVLGVLGVTQSEIAAFKHLARTQAVINKDDTQIAYEIELKKGLIGRIAVDREQDALDHRARVVFEEIQPFLIGESLLDIGCGNGLISNLCRSHFGHIQLMDVVRYVPRWMDLPFTLYKEGAPLGLDRQYDTVLLLTVLHHSNDPVELLKLAWAAARKRVIIIESVVGVHQQRPGVTYNLLDSEDEHQIAFAAFVDWFYNRVLHDNVPVPYNFTTPENWQATFLRHGLPLKETRYFGQDIDIGPEYHMLFVLEKQ